MVGLQSFMDRSFVMSDEVKVAVTCQEFVLQSHVIVGCTSSSFRTPLIAPPITSSRAYTVRLQSDGACANTLASQWLVIAG